MSPAKSPHKGKHRNVATKGVKVEEKEAPDSKKWGCLWITGRVFLWFFGIVFVIFFGLKVMQWMDDIRFSMMDAKDVPVRFEEMRKQGQMMPAFKLLQMRPEEETPQIVAMLLNDADNLEAPFMFVIADRMYKEKPEDALFWAMLARLRLQYDMLRCADYKTAQSVLPIFMLIMLSGDVDEDIHDESKTRPMVQRVLDWDEKHPATYNPGYICAMLTKSDQTIGEARWPAIHYRLVQSAREYLATSAPITAIEDNAPKTPDPGLPGEEDAPVVAPDDGDMNEMPEGVVRDEAVPDDNVVPEDNAMPEEDTRQEDELKEEEAE